VIRRARVDDAAALADINTRGWTFAYSEYVDVEKIIAASGDLEARWREGLSDRHDPRHIWVAEDDGGSVVGFVSVGPSRDDDARVGEGELMAIYLAPEAVGGGVGRALLARGEQSLADLGFRAATLWVFAANDRARRFYERNGWTEEPDSGPGPWSWAPSVRYRKTLSP
jgi:GNAT superfamily N-acetyltransferase